MKVAVVLFFFSLFHLANAQQYNNWAFGLGIGITFSTSSPPANFSGIAMNANEGTATISNQKGELLFYTDGQTVYNRKNEVMKNGAGLLGHPSAFQSSVIIQKPNSDSLFYLFTADAIERDFQKGYCYSVIDLSKDGGLGAVIEKNTPLAGDGTERLTAARHANEIDFWIIGNGTNSNKFYAWRLTCEGIKSAVVSAVGDVLNSDPRMNMGALKISPDGKLLCQTHFPDDANGQNFAQLFDFDNATGIVSNAKKLTFPTLNPHSCEFSPNSQLLYFTDPTATIIGQVETKLATATDIVSSFQSIDAAPGFYAAQLAPDAKIYFANGQRFLSFISVPDAKGQACSFQKNALPLPIQAGVGLPAVVNDLIPSPNGFTFQVLDSCHGLVQFNAFAVNPSQTAWEWNFGDGSSSSLQKPQHSFANVNKKYTVTVKIKPAGACGYITKTKEILPSGYFAEAAFDYSVDCDSLTVRFKNTSVYAGNVSFLWTLGDGATDTAQNPVHFYLAEGTYNATLSIVTPSNCVSSLASKNLVLEHPKVSILASKTEITETETVQLKAVGNLKTVQWSPAETIKTPQANTTLAAPYQDVVYYAEAHTASGCLATDSVLIKVNKLSGIFVPSGFTPNGDGKNEIFAPALGHHYVLKNFVVFNRWGLKLFQTNTKGAGWEGKYNGKVQPMDTYVWLLEATLPGGQTIAKKGTVALIR